MRTCVRSSRSERKRVDSARTVAAQNSAGLGLPPGGGVHERAAEPGTTGL